MKQLKLLLPVAGLVALAVLPVLAQVLPRDLPLRPQRTGFAQPEITSKVETRSFHVGGKKYLAQLKHSDIARSPEWKPSQQLAFGLDGAEVAARLQLHNVVTNDFEWRTADIGLSRLAGTVPAKWYYVVRFTPLWQTSETTDDVVVLLTMDGDAGTWSEARAEQ